SAPAVARQDDALRVKVDGEKGAGSRRVRTPLPRLRRTTAVSRYGTRIFCFAGLGPAAALAFITAPAIAQDDTMTAIASPAQPTAIALGTAPLPGATTSESWHSQYGSMFARNVTEATLPPFLPADGKASGAAVIVAPGGGFRTLSMENEGWDVA